MKCALTYDVGTSSVKAALIRTDGKVLAEAIESYPTQTPHPGWVEQHPDDYWQAICKATRTIVSESNISPRRSSRTGFLHAGNGHHSYR